MKQHGKPPKISHGPAQGSDGKFAYASFMALHDAIGADGNTRLTYVAVAVALCYAFCKLGEDEKHRTES